MKEQKLTFVFHNPNSVEATANHLLKLFLEADQKKLEKVLQGAEASCEAPLPPPRK